MRAIGGVAAGALTIPAGAAAAQGPPHPWGTGYANEGKAVPLPGGRSLYLYCEGAGAPTVILDSGLGDGASSWRRVQHQMAATTRVCSYDRAGYGRSPAGPNPRDTKAEVGDL